MQTRAEYAERYAHLDLVAGVDEVGRGPLAGPVVTAAVILPRNYSLAGLTDSKKVSAKKRPVIAKQILEDCVSYAIGSCTVEEIDQLNILHATMLAMQRAVNGLDVKPQHVLVDGNRCPAFSVSADAIVKGDGLIDCISAASVVAKVHRDNIMNDFAEQYPQYGFDKNSGYPTAQHKAALLEFGASPIHRRSFAPVAAVLP